VRNIEDVVLLCAPCRSDQEAAYENFLHAATVDGPAQASAFAYLGHHFRSVKHEEMKARKCYRRALEINPREASAGTALCELLHESNSEDIVGDICREILATAPNVEWAQRRLGIHNLSVSRAPEAISCLQVWIPLLFFGPSDVWPCFPERGNIYRVFMPPASV
jgi:hypothetical protein